MSKFNKYIIPIGVMGSLMLAIGSALNTYVDVSSDQILRKKNDLLE